MKNHYKKIYTLFIRFFCILLSGYLFLQGLFTLCNIQKIHEKTYYVKNNPFTQLTVILLFTLLAFILLKPRIWNWLAKYGHFIFWALTLFMVLFLIWWVTQTVFWYYGDAEWMYTCAQELLDGNYSQWEPGGYAHMWPFQSATILLIAAILKFFSLGQSFYIFPILCIIFYLITIVSLYAALQLLFRDKALVNIQGIMLSLYLPYAFLTMCMLGDLIGYGWGALSIYHAVKYSNENDINRLRNLIFSGIFLFLSICFKPNCSIFLVGIIILFILNLSEKKYILRSVICLSGFIVIVFAGIKLPGLCMEGLSGLKMPAGNSKWAHLAMGAQESDKAPGWYNDYNAVIFAQNDYDTKKTAIKAKSDLRDSLKNFADNPSYAWSFYNRKLASEWNNPTMECFHVQNCRNTARELSSFVKSLINDGGKINILVIWFLDIGQSILFFGIFMYFLHEKSANYKQLFWGLLFIGAFVFWMFWEAKCRYVAPYVLFLIPYSFPGYQILIQRLKEKRIFLSLLVISAIICFLQFSNSTWVTDSFKINQDTEAYYEYLHEYNKNFLNLRY